MVATQSVPRESPRRFSDNVGGFPEGHGNFPTTMASHPGGRGVDAKKTYGAHTVDAKRRHTVDYLLRNIGGDLGV